MGTGHRFISFTALAMLLFITLFLMLPADAVPAFSRRAGGVSCNMCHWHQNALNATGKQYLQSGVRLPGEQADVTASDFKVGDYASLVLAPNLSAVEHDGTVFSAGDAVLWLGGPVDNLFSALAEVEFKIDDEEVEVEEVYVHFVSDLGNNYFSARFGQFQPFLFLSNVSGPPRITLSRPEVMSGRATNDNTFRPRNRLRGIELGAVDGPLAGYVGLGNGTGQNASDNHMDVYVTVERAFGTQGSSIGAWAYWGEAVLTGGFRDSFERYGVIGNYTAQKTRAVGGLLFGDNEDPGGADLDNDGWFLEIDQRVGVDTVAYFRWDEFNRDLAAGGERETDGPTLGISWTPTELSRFTIEAQSLDTDGTDVDSIVVEMHLAI